MDWRVASPRSIRVLFWVVAAGTLLSLAPMASLGVFLLAHAPVFVLLLLGSAQAWWRLRQGQGTSTTRVARILGACLASTIFMVLLHWSIRTDRSSTAAIAYFWTPLLVPVVAVLGALLAWAFVATARRLAGRSRVDGAPSSAG